MHRSLSCAVTSLLVGLSLLAGPAALSSPAERVASSLSVSPTIFVGGQRLTFSGTLAGAPNAKLKIQTLFNRAGDSWETRDGVVATTDARGDFSFGYPAPNNFGISYRVIAVGGPASPAQVLEPRQQEVVLALNGGADQAPGTVVSGETFTIDVNTTPTGRGDLGRPPPAFPGRTLVLEKRVRGDQWTTVDTTAANSLGAAQFVLTAGAVGDIAYRVVQREVLSDGNRIGWFPSYPLELSVAPPGTVVLPPPPPPSSSPLPTGTTPHGTATPLASARYRWGPAQWDFAWEEGESLTDKPFRGTRRVGSWLDRSDGSGRVAHYNGGMALSTHVSEFPGDGDHGNVSAALTGNPITYGRWEFRRRIDIFEEVGAQYRVLIELVPAAAKDDHCGANTITVADTTFDASSARLGVSSHRANKSWSGTVPIRRIADGPHSFGIEVTRNHITWFLDGASLATVKGKTVAPGVPLTPRLSLVGRGGEEMQRTRVLYDWQRGWPLNKQARKADVGPALKPRRLKGAC